MRLSQFTLPASCMTTDGRDSPVRRLSVFPFLPCLCVQTRMRVSFEAAPHQRQNAPGPIITERKLKKKKRKKKKLEKKKQNEKARGYLTTQFRRRAAGIPLVFRILIDEVRTLTKLDPRRCLAEFDCAHFFFFFFFSTITRLEFSFGFTFFFFFFLMFLCLIPGSLQMMSRWLQVVPFCPLFPRSPAVPPSRLNPWEVLIQ